MFSHVIEQFKVKLHTSTFVCNVSDLKIILQDLLLFIYARNNHAHGTQYYPLLHARNRGYDAHADTQTRPRARIHAVKQARA